MVRKIRNYAYVTVFILVVVVIGCLSCTKLINFYVNDEKDYNEWSPELGSKFETDIASTFYKKFEFVNVNGAVRNVLGQPSMNGVVKLNNGYLFTPMEYSSDEMLQDYADATIRFNLYLKERGTKLIYVTPPTTLSKYDNQLPIGIQDYGNDNIDRLLQMLADGGIDTIDLRDSMHSDGIDQYSMMYKTDHHWTTRAGFYAYGVIEKYITDATGCIVDERVSDINNYNVIKYDKWQLGSRGQRTGIYYTGIDDFELIVPAFDTKIQNYSEKVGKMQDIVFNMDALENNEYSFKNTYDSVLGESLGYYTNLDCPNDVRILTITDSFGKAVNPYLAIGFKQLDYIYDGDVSGVTPERIEEFDPDVVIMLYYPDMLNEKSKSFAFENFE